METDTSLIDKLINEVVKPLADTQAALTASQEDFSQANEALERLNDELTSLRDCFNMELQNMDSQSTYLDELTHRFRQSSAALEALSTNLSMSIQSSIVKATDFLKQALQNEVREGLELEVGEAMRALKAEIHSAKNTIAVHQSITRATHMKFIGAALLVGSIVGTSISGFVLRKINALPCHCQCSLRQASGNAVKSDANTGKPQHHRPE